MIKWGYDIRGIYKEDIDEDFARKVGFLISSRLFQDFYAIGIGRDNRAHSERIKDALSEGIRSNLPVIDFGRITTPSAQYLSTVYKIPVVMITASHNPPEYTGMKFFLPSGEDLLREDLLKIKEWISEEISIPSPTEDEEKDLHAFELYKWILRKRFRKVRGYRIGFDPGNGMGVLLKDILEDLGNDVHSINDKLDGRFPNHLPDPSRPENLRQLQEIVVKKELDLGIALDGDCDRVGIVTREGKIFSPDKIFYSFISPGKTYVAEVMLPLYLEEVAEEKGAKIVRTRTGRIYAKSVAREVNAFMFGEHSGHFGFKEFGYIDDGLYTALKLLEYLNRERRWLDDVLKEIPKIEYEELELPTESNVISKLKKYATEHGLKTREIDGIEVFIDDGRILARKSNTEPLIRVVVEGRDIKDLLSILESLTC